MTTVKEYYNKNMDDDGRATLVEDVYGNPELWIEKNGEDYVILDQDMWNDINCQMDQGAEDVEEMKDRWLNYIT